MRLVCIEEYAATSLQHPGELEHAGNEADICSLAIPNDGANEILVHASALLEKIGNRDHCARLAFLGGPPIPEQSLACIARTTNTVGVAVSQFRHFFWIRRLRRKGLPRRLVKGQGEHDR